MNCTRREWIGKLLSASGACAALAPVVSGAAQQLFLPTETLRIRISDVSALGEIGGSVRATFDAWGTPLMINRASASQFHVMDPTCTHAGCGVDLYDHNFGQISCPCHGSSFSISGQVLGGPATQNLPSYRSQYANGILEVEIPGLRFGIRTVSPMRTALGAPRLRLSFPTKSFSFYRVRKAAHPAGPFALVSFATQLDGALNQTQLTGTGSEKQVFVDAAGTTAFFVLELVMTYES